MADTPDSPSSPGRSPLELLGERLRRMSEGRHVLANLALLCVVSVAAAFIISPGLYGQHLPELRPADIGQPFQAVSASGFKATRDYDILHTETTETRREEARQAVRPVFDLDPTVVQGLRRGVEGAFALMRTRVPAQENSNVDMGDDEESFKQKRKKSEQEAAGEALFAERARFEELLVAPEDEDFLTLVNVRFSRQVEQMVVVLLERAFQTPIVSGRDELSRAGIAGITIRELGANTERSSPLGAPALLDVREAQAELDRFASVPGNLPPDWPVLLRRAVLRLAKLQLRANLFFNADETKTRRDEAAAAINHAVIQIKKGQKIIGDGELISPLHLVILKGMGAQADSMERVQLQVGGALLVALLIAFTFGFFRTSFTHFRPTRKDGILLALVLLGTLGATHVWVGVADALHDKYSSLPAESLYFLAPLCAGAMLIRFLLHDLAALFFCVVVSVLSALLMGNSLSFGIFALLTSLAGAQWIGRAKERVGIFKAGAAAGVAGALTVVALAFAEGKGLTGETALTAAAAMLSGLLTGPMIVIATTPILETLLGYASDIKLLELANLNHPALKELIVQAPGTYHHSIIIGSLVEGAAEAIGANPLLARSCAYYHDIGKGRNPLYFGENQKGENRHDTLAPAMSAVIIKRHVTEGMEMARQYKLPKLVADAIPQHHGTRLVGYFFHKAVKEQEGKENAPPVDESIYRYPGPKPQFREAALVMIADAVEAASRSMPDPTSVKLQLLVQKLINVIFSEGQLDECDLTLKDLNLIAQSFANTLEGIYHARPSYPAGAISGPKALESSAPSKSKATRSAS